VIENEFGEENIDNDILVSDTKEQIVQMSNGCICCTIREDLRATLQLLAAKKRKGMLDFDRIVIETTACRSGRWRRPSSWTTRSPRATCWIRS
jgi:G3E family GTPase